MGARFIARSVADNLKPGGVFLMASGAVLSASPLLPLQCLYVAAHPPLFAPLRRTPIVWPFFFGEDGQLQRESSDSGLDEFCAALMLPSGP